MMGGSCMAKNRDADSYLLMLLERYRQQSFSAGVAHGMGMMDEEQTHLTEARKTREEIEQELRNR